MRDTRRRRLVLVVLILLSLTLIALGGGTSGPGKALRDVAATVFGPVQRTVAAAFRPVHDFFGGLSSDDQARLDQLQKENDQLRLQTRADEYTAARAAELDALLRIAGLGRYTIKAAQVISMGPAQSFDDTALLDAGSRDGLKVGMTVINGQGLVGKIAAVTSSTATVLLAIDPRFKVPARQERGLQLAYVAGAGARQPMTFHPFDAQAVMVTGGRVVTSQLDLVPGGVPIGILADVSGSVGALDRSATLTPYVDFGALDLVGVVVVLPRTDPRDSVLPPVPTASSSSSPSAGSTASSSPTPSASASR